jgi:hypothetical protein
VRGLVFFDEPVDEFVFALPPPGTFGQSVADIAIVSVAIVA